MIWPLYRTSTSAVRTAITVTPLRLSPTAQTSTALLIVFNIASELPMVPTSETGTLADVGVTGLTVGTTVATATGVVGELGSASPNGWRSGVFQIFSNAEISGSEGPAVGLMPDIFTVDSGVAR